MTTRAEIEALSSGGYVFLPPLGERQTRAFELRAGVSLPEQYRRFLAMISAGGTPTRTGPPHLMTLEQAARAIAAEGGVLAHRFALTPADSRDTMRDDARTPEQDLRPAIVRELKDGVLPLMDLGGGEMDFLVVTGTLRGHVWRAWEAGWSPLWFLHEGQPSPHGFDSWFRATLKPGTVAAHPT